MKNLKLFATLLFALQPFSAHAEVLVDFTSEVRAGFWSPLTDQIRGGTSTIFMEVLPNQTAQISGNLQLIDGAGFASYRVQPIEKPSWDLKNANDLIVEASGDGRTYRVILKDEAAMKSAFDYSWQADLDTSSNLKETKLPLQSFKAVYRGREIKGVPALDQGKILEIGIQINDKNPGAFDMRLKAISAK